MAVDAGLWPTRRSVADYGYESDARGRDGGVRQKVGGRWSNISQAQRRSSWDFPKTARFQFFQQPASCLLEREDCTLKAWYPSLYAPRTGGAYDGHHRTAGIAGCTRRHSGGVAARGARTEQIRCTSAEICAPCRPDSYRSSCYDRQYHS